MKRPDLKFLFKVQKVLVYLKKKKKERKKKKEKLTQFPEFFEQI